MLQQFDVKKACTFYLCIILGNQMPTTLICRAELNNTVAVGSSILGSLDDRVMMM